MKANRLWFILLLCLLGVGLVGFLVSNHYQRPPAITITEPATLDSRPAESATAGDSRSAFRRELVKPTSVKPTPDPGSASQAAALASLGSPGNSADPDANREWARNFPAEALAWLKNAPEGKQRLTIAEIACSYLAQTNPAAAVTLAENFLGGSTNTVAQYLLDNLAQQWAGQDMQAASAWALAKPAGEQRDRLLQRIAIVESSANPAEAARLISEQMSPGQFQNEAAISVLYQWAQKDAAAALAWAESFPPGDLRDRAIKEVKNVSAYAAAAAAGNPPQN